MHGWMTRFPAVPAPRHECRLLVRCSDVAPRKPAVKMLVAPTRTTTPRKLPITPLLCRLSRTCHLIPLADPTSLPWLRPPLLHQTVPLRLLLRPILRSRKNRLAMRRLLRTSLRPGRWRSMRTTMTKPMRTRRLLPRRKAAPMATAPNRPMAMDLPATVAQARLRRLNLRRKKWKSPGSSCNETSSLALSLGHSSPVFFLSPSHCVMYGMNVSVMLVCSG